MNYKAAKATRRIAEDTRKVAMLAQQDSTDMRVISVTTLLFLPAMFVAVRIPYYSRITTQNLISRRRSSARTSSISNLRKAW